MNAAQKFRHEPGPKPSVVPEKAPEPAEMEIRLGLRPVMTSKGPSEAGNRWIRPGVIVSLPRHEAENLLELGYATRV
jgi:hypothetical protein